MIAADEDALICDLAETYQIFEYRALPVKLLATLAVGLRPNSRIKQSLSGVGVSAEEMLLAGIADRIGHLNWMMSEDGQKGTNKPQSILDILMGKQPSEGNKTVMTFSTAEEYESAMKSAKQRAGGERNGD